MRNAKNRSRSFAKTFASYVRVVQQKTGNADRCELNSNYGGNAEGTIAAMDVGSQLHLPDVGFSVLDTFQIFFFFYKMECFLLRFAPTLLLRKHLTAMQ